MSRKKKNDDADEAARLPGIIYGSYPGADLLIIDPPTDESPEEFCRKAEFCGDTLFLFLCREACDDDMNFSEFEQRLAAAIKQMQAVRSAVLQKMRP